MNHTHTSLCIALMTAICGHACGGEINPPAGPIAPTMKSLDRIEPRVCINDLPGDQTAMHVITSPGNYYLADDITVEPGKSGIVVRLSQDTNEDSISIDMDGFSITGLQGSLSGIDCPASPIAQVERFHVKQEFGQTSGTRRCGGDGVSVMGADEVFIDISSENNGGAGIRVGHVTKFKAGSELSKKVNIANNGGGGGGGGVIVVECESASLHGMNVSDNMGDGVRIMITDPDNRDESISMDEMTLHGNIGDGIEILHSSGDNARVRIRSASMDGNAGDGMKITDNGDESISYDFDELSSSHNGGYGANLEALSSARVSVTITDSRFATNVLSGLRAVGDEGGTLTRIAVRGSVASGNGGSGFECLALGGRFDSCDASDNAVHGYDVDAAPDLMGIATRKGYDYYKSVGQRNVANGIDGNSCTLTVNVCHLISNGGHGLQVSAGAADIRSSSFDDNFGSGVRAIDSDIRSQSTIMSENALYGIHSSSGPGTTRVMALDSGKILRNSEGGCLSDGGDYICCQSTHFIANGGGGGGGTGSGIDAIDAAAVLLTDCSSTGNTGDGVSIRSSGNPALMPTQIRLDGVLAARNGAHGIYSEKAAFGGMRGCDTNANGGDGIHAAADATGLHIEACASSGNAGAGFNVVGVGNVLVNNTAISNIMGAVMAPVPGNIVGPQIDEGGVQQNGNPAAIYNR
ncbi:MAG: right-handed parallel beta-helix repeat-containing protein [Phycisphaeraceae bacterium]|nr:right-handed parallel beta-helix repeat-containing protein [Phycisphaeraceae bacterium]MCB9848728.1 right-handed parallel beta-helix repeat-containing protein [Phycisphaeraceae bacterium]